MQPAKKCFIWGSASQGAMPTVARWHARLSGDGGSAGSEAQRCVRLAHLVRLEQARGRCSLNPYSASMCKFAWISASDSVTLRSRSELTSAGATAADLAPEREQAEPME